MDIDEDEGYQWQHGLENNWEIMNNDESVSNLVRQMESKKRKNQKRPCSVRLGMMRYTILFIDMTEAMKIIDLKPTRLSLTVKNAKLFVENYFDQNPISQLGICIIKNGTVEELTSLGGNPRKHIDALNGLNEGKCEGEPSLQNVLEYAERLLKHIPLYATREVIIVMASMTTCDRGNIHDTIASVQRNLIRCSVISLTAEVYVYKKLTKLSSGKFQVILDEADLKLSFQNLVLPPPSFKENEASLIHMGFPSCKKYDTLFKICSCHQEYQHNDTIQSYCCPRCGAAYCDLPIECNICGLILVSAPHLARSYHHLFPLNVFVEASVDDRRTERKCSACDKTIHADENSYICSSCSMHFCLDCDEFLHSSVHVCPNCSEKPIRSLTD